MSEFQQVVNRQYTLGFIGEIIRDGVLRAKPGRIKSDTALNGISRVFTYSGNTGTPADSVANAVGYAAQTYEVESGGTGAFFGILAHPKHYALSGGQAGTLSPTMTLQKNSEGEFVDCTSGMLVEVFNETTTAKNVNYGDKLAFCNSATTPNAQGVPQGGIITYSGATPPTGFIAIPNAFVTLAVTIGASAAGAPVAGALSIQMAN